MEELYNSPPFKTNDNMRNQKRIASKLWGCNATTNCSERMQYAFFPKYDNRTDDTYSEMYYPTIKNIPNLFKEACCADFWNIGNLTTKEAKLTKDQKEILDIHKEYGFPTVDTDDHLTACVNSRVIQ